MFRGGSGEAYVLIIAVLALLIEARPMPDRDSIEAIAPNGACSPKDMAIVRGT